MSDLIERVARAIYCDGTFPPYVVGANEDKWRKTSETQREFCRLQARAAIEAMREPTETMVKAAHTKGDDPRYHPGECGTSAERYWPLMVRRWENMIDAALGKTDGT